LAGADEEFAMIAIAGGFDHCFGDEIEEALAAEKVGPLVCSHLPRLSQLEAKASPGAESGIKDADPSTSAVGRQQSSVDAELVKADITGTP
jgi:hypothetical protein